MDVDLHSEKIVKNYLDNGIDMNDSIAKMASENNFNIEQTKRLVEECNKNCFLSKFASTGEQTFDVADYKKVKSLITENNEIKKEASYNHQLIDTGSLGYGISLESDCLEKNASENNNLNSAILECQNKINFYMDKIANLKSRFEHVDEIGKIEKLAEEYVLIKNHLIEKRAGLTSGLLSGVSGAAVKVGGKVATTVIKHPIKAGLIPMGLLSSFKEGAKKVSQETSPIIGNITKNAGVAGTEAKAASEAIEKILPKMIENAAPIALVMGALGVGAAVAKGIGGLASRMMTDHQLDKSFQTIESNNEDIRQIPNARSYFDVIARHSPSLALDPMVAPQLIRQFNMFDGVDINTIGKLREIENEGSRGGHIPDNTLGTFMSGASTLSKFHPKSEMFRR